MKKKNIKKIIIVTLIAIPIGLLLYYLLPLIISVQINNYKYGFVKDNNISTKKHINFFNKKEIKLSSSWNSRSGAFVNFYKYNSDEITILKLSQYQNIDLKKMDIKSYLPPYKKIEHITYIGFPSNNYPYIFFGLYVIEASNADIYIDVPIQKAVRKDNYIYLKFRTNLFSISGTDSYPQLEFSVPGKYIPFEFLVLKKDNNVYFILKYPFENQTSGNKKDSLLDIINIE